MRFDAESVPARCEGVEASRLGSDFVVLDPSGKLLRGVNGTGARVLELVDGRRSARSIAQALAAEFRAPLTRALPDTLTFLNLLAEQGIVKETPTSASPGGVS